MQYYYLFQKLLGDDVEIHDGGKVVGFKGLDEYDLDEITDEQLAADPDLDLDTGRNMSSKIYSI